MSDFVSEDRTLAFLTPEEVRLWTKASGYTIHHIPVNVGDTVDILKDGQGVGKLVLEDDPNDPWDCIAVTYWDSERG